MPKCHIIHQYKPHQYRNAGILLAMHTVVILAHTKTYITKLVKTYITPNDLQL